MISTSIYSTHTVHDHYLPTYLPTYLPVICYAFLYSYSVALHLFLFDFCKFTFAFYVVAWTELLPRTVHFIMLETVYFVHL